MRPFSNQRSVSTFSGASCKPSRCSILWNCPEGRNREHIHTVIQWFIHQVLHALCPSIKQTLIFHPIKNPLTQSFIHSSVHPPAYSCSYPSFIYRSDHSYMHSLLHRSTDPVYPFPRSSNYLMMKPCIPSWKHSWNHSSCWFTIHSFVPAALYP